jgi:molybdate transport system substrate-binding protein
LLLLTFGLVLAAGCGDDASAGDPGETTELSVFAAAGLTQAFTELGEQFSASHPDVKVTFNFAGGPTLVSQIEQGATPDVFAIADTDNMEKVADFMGESQVFARNRMAIIVGPGNPEGIESLADLSDENLKVVLGDPALPAGKCANKILAEQGIVVKPVSLEESVKGIVTKVSFGEADAGMAWVSEIATADGKVEGIDIPDRQNVIELFPIAVAKGCDHADAAQAFVDFVFSDAGQRVLGSYDFMPPR